MPTDTGLGTVDKKEDFLVTAIADLPEIDINTVAATGVTEVIAGSDGRLRLGVHTSDDDDRAAVSFGALNWTAGDGELYMEARFLMSSITDNKYFVGFGDTIASTDETIFDCPADVVDIQTMSDAIGIGFDQDATTKVLWCLAAKTNAVTVQKTLNAKYNPTTAAMVTLGVYLSTDRKSAAFYVNGEEVYRIDSTSTLIAAVALVPIVVNYEQLTANNMDVDYLYGRKGRAAV